MIKKLLILLPPLLMFLLGPAGLSAQQSSKSKSKDRYREKDIIQPPLIRNAAAINGAGMDFSPIYYGEGIVYLSNSSTPGPAAKKHSERKSFDMFFALLDGNEEPLPPSEFSAELNSNLNEGQATFSRDKKYIFFTRNNSYKGVQKADASGKVNMKIYQARYARYDWDDIKELPFNEDSYSCMHPSLSVDGTKLYFTSDMPGGYGGFDLYVSEYDGANWSAPVNLGPEINTDKNELFPFITFGGKTLLFSSSGHHSLGGLDMFYVNLDNIGEGVVNLNEPFNSPSDDLSMILNKDGTKGFFTSNREGGHGLTDIYSFTVPNGIQGVEKAPTQRVEIVVTDGRSGQPIPGAAIRILEPTDDGFLSSKNDFYEVDMAPTPESPNSLSLRLIRKNADELGNPDDYTNQSGVSYGNFSMFRSYLILASYDGYQTAERLYSVQPDKGGAITLALFEEAICHRMTGIVSTDKFNTRIANATLVFTHLESNQQLTYHTDINGEYNLCLPLEGEYLLQVKREGFRSNSMKVEAKRGKSVSNSIRLEPVELSTAVAGTDAQKEEAMLARPLQDGYIITMDKIRFEPGKATLNQSAVRHLDAIVELMQRYPEMEIDLVVHTDSRGDDKSNQILSDERAKNAKTYLAYKGIEGKRINAFGKGEKELRNRCADGVQCADAEHELNNRIEVKVRKVGSAVRTP